MEQTNARRTNLRSYFCNQRHSVWTVENAVNETVYAEVLLQQPRSQGRLLADGSVNIQPLFILSPLRQHVRSAQFQWSYCRLRQGTVPWVVLSRWSSLVACFVRVQNCNVESGILVGSRK